MDRIRICFLIAALNELDIQLTDVGNAYFNALTKEKCHAVADNQFGSDEGKIVKIDRALYGLKSSEVSWHAHYPTVCLIWC